MIKNFEPQPYDGLNPLPSYVTNVSSFTLTGSIPGGYEITLAKLTVGESVSAGNPLSHALFESFDDHGRRMKATRTRVSGFDREFVAVKSAMSGCGFAFHPALPGACETILYALGEFFQAQNPEIAEVAIVSQSCH